MKKSVMILLPLLLALFCISAPLSATTRGISVVSKNGQNLYLYKDYQALVVGVSNYERWPKLPNASKDAMEVANGLNRMGVHVKLVLDPTYRELRSALTNMVYSMGREKNRGIIFYYAGHGETETLADGNKMGYIIPKDCPLLKNNPAGFATHSVSMREIESASLKIRSKHVLMLFDSCFSGALFALVRAVPHDITEKSSLPVRQYITAGREDEEVPDKSMFKRCLLIGLEGDADLTGDGYITGSELGMYLSDKVVNYTHRQQHPQYGKINNPDLDRGDFIFSVNTSLASSETAPSISPTSESQRLAEERSRLERARRELEEMRALIEERRRLDEERKRLEAEKQRYEMAKLTSRTEQLPSVSGGLEAKEIGRDGRFIAYDNGTVLDTKTNLMWAAKDEGEDTRHFPDAETYCSKYEGGGYTDWRIPTVAELKTIYNSEMRNKNSWHITKLIDITSEWIWAKEGWWGDQAALNFRTGAALFGGWAASGQYTGYYGLTRTLPVRNAENVDKEILAKESEISKHSLSVEPKKTKYDNRFVAYNNGTVLDTTTNLMWADTEAEVNGFYHSDAEEYCKNFRGAGHKDWRMPTLDEVETLYDEKIKNKHGCHITTLINVESGYIWAELNSWGGPAAFNFRNGFPVLKGYSKYYGWQERIESSVRVLPVRSGN